MRSSRTSSTTHFRAKWRRVLIPALAALLIPLSLGAATIEPMPAPGSPAYLTWLGASVQRLSDQEALRTVAYSYGRGNDLLAIHHGDRAQGRAQALGEFTRAFTPDVVIEVYALGGDKPFRAVAGIPAWIEFGEGYFAANKFSSTAHLMSNFIFEFPDKDSATVSCYASVPHFILNPTAREAVNAGTSLEYMVCRYVHQAKRQADGTWKTYKLTIYLEEIWRTGGFYPGGQGAGK